MKIETRFNIGDEVYAVVNEKFVKTKVIDFEMDFGDEKPLSDRIRYKLEKVQRFDRGLEFMAIRKESDLYASVSEYVEHIKGLGV